MPVSNLCKVALVDVKASTIINTPVDMANPKCSCHCGCNNVVTFSGGNLCEPCNDNHNQFDAVDSQTGTKVPESQSLGSASAHIREFSIKEVVD
ncbi:uncharacterized protein FMAN_11480 [Fusarium mangiferae]|uniref:Uncharacterized protein n=1 Tax=Fusarium mangiferae TaxID=192010 RepID=A0A1L7TQ37_FUSMA|nr:uncharacterized protein FMAN_11480 [Fusarium mangiferae]CVK97381.1 uncharacterized protein FMAN_11480 [Fusarium mangiferae]